MQHDSKSEEVARYINMIASGYLNGYSEYDDVTRATLIVDKILLGMNVAKMAIMCSLSDEYKAFFHDQTLPNGEHNKARRLESIQSTMKETEKCFECVDKELKFLNKFVRESQNNAITNIERKLNDILLGPDYPEGKKLMQDAKKDFNERTNK